MPTYTFTSPDGSSRTITSPRGLSDQELTSLNPFAKVKKVPSPIAAAEGGVRAQAAIGEAIHGLLTDPEKRKAAGKAALEFGKREALPLAGTIAGGFAPVPGGAFVGRAIGGAVGEASNQALGITEPSITDIALSGGAGAIGGGTPRVLKSGTRGVAAFAAPTAMRAQGPRIAREVLTKGAKASTLYSVAAQQAPLSGKTVVGILENALSTVRRPRARRQLKESINALSKTTSERIGGQAELTGFTRTTISPQDTLTHKTVMDEIKRIRQEATAAFKAHDTNSGVELSEAGKRLIEETSKLSPALAQANTAWRREKAIESVVKAMRRGNPVTSIDELLETDQLVFGVLTAAEQQGMRDLAMDMARITSATVAGRFVMPVIEPVADLMTNSRGQQLLKFLLKQPGMTASTLAAAAAQLTRGALGRTNVPTTPKPGQPVPTR